MVIEEIKKPKKGSEHTLLIETLAYGGLGVARLNGYVILVDGALPGQQVLARVMRNRKGYAEARVLEIIKKSDEEVVPRCSHFNECGGCRFQNLSYKAQIKYKQQQVIESLEHIGGFKQPNVLSTIPSPNEYFYRNKMEFSFGRQRWVSQQEIAEDELLKPKDFALGMHVRGRYDKILDIDECFLISEKGMEIVNFVKSRVSESNIPVYSTADYAGFWRHVVIRDAQNTNDLLINFVTTSTRKHFDFVESLKNELINKFPNITTIVHNINDRKAEVAIGDSERVLHGSGKIIDKIGNFKYQISANSFFQTNTKAAELLYNKILEFGEFKGNETVYDLYAGAGTISIYISQNVQKVVGFEIVEAAVLDAKKNCEINDINNCVFIIGDIKGSLNSESTSKYGKPDIVIIDPPRAGMHNDVLQQLMKIKPKKLIYVSCNPTTFARDVKELCSWNYAMREVQPVDMFPMTPHIELVSKLELK